MSHEFTRLDLYQPIGSEPLRAMLRYFAGIVTHREEVPSRKRDCELLLVQGRPLDEIAPPGPWQKIWEGARPGDKDERYRLYQRSGKS